MSHCRTVGAKRRAAQFAPLVLMVLLASALAGCFVSNTPLIGASEASFPFQRIVYKSSESDDIVTLKRQSDTYLGTSEMEPETLEFRFKAVAGDVYLVQVADQTRTPAVYYYGYLTVDLPSRIVRAYKIIAGEKEKGDGLKPCGNGQICIDRLDRYQAFVETAIARGETPEGEFRILELE